jgi:short-subunit dehydrogenase
MPLPRTPSLRLDNRRALVTGAGRGIGQAAAAALAQAGAHVTLLARTATEITETAQELLAEGLQADTITQDIQDQKALTRALSERPPYDILVNNAGTNRPRTFLDVTEDDYDAITELNQKAAFFTAQTIARRMVETGTKGSIINISSQMGHVGGQNRTVYCMTKHGIEGLTKAMAIDLAPHGIRVNSIGPTFIDTPLTRPFFQNNTFRQQVLSKIKLGRLGTVEDLMGAVVYLSSDAAALVTGTALLIDGGWTAD